MGTALGVVVGPTTPCLMGRVEIVPQAVRDSVVETASEDCASTQAASGVDRIVVYPTDHIGVRLATSASIVDRARVRADSARHSADNGIIKAAAFRISRYEEYEEVRTQLLGLLKASATSVRESARGAPAVQRVAMAVVGHGKVQVLAAILIVESVDAQVNGLVSGEERLVLIPKPYERVEAVIEQVGAVVVGVLNPALEVARLAVASVSVIAARHVVKEGNPLQTLLAQADNGAFVITERVVDQPGTEVRGLTRAVPTPVLAVIIRHGLFSRRMRARDIPNHGTVVDPVQHPITQEGVFVVIYGSHAAHAANFVTLDGLLPMLSLTTEGAAIGRTLLRDWVVQVATNGGLVRLA